MKWAEGCGACEHSYDTEVCEQCGNFDKKLPAERCVCGVVGCMKGCTPVRPAAAHEPPPTPGRERVLDAVLEDLRARAEEGRKKYGTYLETHNGRRGLMDAYQEALDLVMYLKQCLMEEKLK